MGASLVVLAVVKQCFTLGSWIRVVRRFSCLLSAIYRGIPTLCSMKEDFDCFAAMMHMEDQNTRSADGTKTTKRRPRAGSGVDERRRTTTLQFESFVIAMWRWI